MLQRLKVFAAVSGCVIMFALATPANVRGADISDTARAKVKEMGDAIVTVNVVIGMKFSYKGQGGEEQEIKNEARGSVVDESGMTIVPLSEIDPTQMWKRMMGSESEDVQYSSTLKDLKLILSSGKEIPATVVLRDNDLDLAVIRPLEKQKDKFACLNLKDSADGNLLDPIFCITRMGPIGNRQIRAMTSEIESIVPKPRLFYVSSESLASGGTGVPVFNRDGKIIGLLVIKVLPGAADSNTQRQEDPYIPIILPVSDVLDVIKQAPEKAPEVKPAAEEKTEAKSAPETEAPKPVPPAQP